ncbi:MAG: peptidylprolyl isomerase [Myxococcota bacterium]
MQTLDHLAMRELIHRRLLLQEARRRHLAVSSEEVDQGVASLRRRFFDLASFGRWMAEHGLNDRTLFEAVGEEILVGRMKQALVRGSTASPDQIDRYYEAHQAELKAGEEVRVRVIAVKDRAAADAIMAALQKGASFSAIAQQRSLGYRARQGGDIGWLSAESLPPPIRENVQAMKVGAARGPLRRGSDFLIVRLDGRRQGRPLTLAEAQPRIERHLLAQRREEILHAWLAEQERSSKIEVFSPVASSDPVEKSRPRKD